MRVEDVRAECRCQLLDAVRRSPPFPASKRRPVLREPARLRIGSAMKLPAVDVLDLGGAPPPCRGVVSCSVSQPARPLLAQDGESPKRVAAVQRKRVIEDVQDAHGAVMRASWSSATSAVPASTTLRRNASNISSVHSGAL